MAAPSLPPPRALLVALWTLLLPLAAGFSWSVMASRLGPALFETGAFTSAAQGSEFLRELQPRYLLSPAVEGAVTTIPFEPALWGDPAGAKCRLTRMRVDILVPGLTHTDFVVDQTANDRLLFRLSRHPNVPSGFIRQRRGLARQWPCDRDWSVPESILEPARRAELQQVNYQWPHRSRPLITGEFQARWLRVEIERRGAAVSARVDGRPAGEVHMGDLARGAWGLEGGDLPSAYLARIEFQGRRLRHGDWRAFEERWSFAGAAPAARDAARSALGVLGGLLLFASAGWLLAPGVGWTRWLQRSLVAGGLLAWLPGRAVLFHDVQSHATLGHIWHLSLWAWGLTLGLFLAGSGPHWRWRAAPRPAPSLLRALRANLIALGGLGRLAWMLSLLAVFAALWAVRSGALVRSTMAKQPAALEFVRDQTLRRGDFPFSRPKGWPERDFVNGGMRVTLEAIEDETTVELLARLHDKSLPSYPDWLALRLSTSRSDNGFLESAMTGIAEPVTLHLRTGEPVEIALWSEGDTFVATAASAEIGRFTTGVDPFGQFAIVVRRGAVHVASAQAWGDVDAYGSPGASLLHRLPVWLWITAACLLAPAVAFGLAWPLASWLGLRVGGVALFLLAVALMSAGVATWQGLWWIGRPLEEYWSSPRFALFAALLVAAGGLQLLVASHWDRLSRRVLPALCAITAVLLSTEGAIRSTAQRWRLDAHVPRGYIHRHLLLRWLQEPMVLMTLTGELRARGETARPRVEGDGRLRIICLGGSSVYGSGVASDGDTWPALVERQLASTEVFNFGRPSLTAFDNLLLLRRDLLALDPDWVILSAGGNDAVRPVGSPPPQRARWEALWSQAGWQEHLERALTRTRLLVFLNHWLRGALTPIDRQRRVPQHPPEELRQTLHDLCELGRRRGFRVALLAEPTWDSVVSGRPDLAAWHRVIAQTASREGAVLIDPGPRLRDAMADQLWVTWIHFNERGNRVMADEVVTALRPHLD